MSDGSSFLIEYAPTHRPVVYLDRADGCGLDETLEDDVLKGYYVARTGDEIAPLIAHLASGADPLKAERERRQANMSIDIFEGQAGKRIAAYLKASLAGSSSRQTMSAARTAPPDDDNSPRAGL